jgi:putative SOS response-associated peptidase YedK
VLGWLHNRIPCLLTTDESVATWLDPATPVPAALAALQLPPAETIAWHPVAAAVGNVRQCAAASGIFIPERD